MKLLLIGVVLLILLSGCNQNYSNFLEHADTLCRSEGLEYFYEDGTFFCASENGIAFELECGRLSGLYTCFKVI